MIYDAFKSIFKKLLYLETYLDTYLDTWSGLDTYLDTWIGLEAGNLDCSVAESGTPPPCGFCKFLEP